MLWSGLLVAAALDAVDGFAAWRRRPPLLVPVMVHLVVLVLATMTSRAPAVSFLGNYGRFGGLATAMAVVALAHMLAVELRRDRAAHVQLAVTLTLSALAGAGYLWLQELGVDAFDWLEPWREPPRHPPGALGNSNFSGAHLAIALPAALWLAHRGRGWVRSGWLGAALVLVSGVAVSQSRGAMLAVAAGLVVGAVRLRLPVRPIVGTALALLVGLTMVAGVTNDRGLDELTGSATWSERVDLWQVALEGWLDHPVLGGGPDLYRLTFAEHAGPTLDGLVADEPHNVLLDQLDGAGLLGAASWVALVVAAVRVARRSPQRREATLWLAVGAAYLAQAMVSIDVVPLQLWGWVALAGIAGTADDDRPGARRAPAGVRAAAVLGCVALAVVASGPFRADMAHRRGIEASNAGDGAAAIHQLRQAVDRHGWEPRYHRRLGIQLAITGQATGNRLLLDEARRELERAIDLAASDPVADRWLATLQE